MPAYRFALTSCCLIFVLLAPALHAQDEGAELKQAREAYAREMDFATRPIRDRYLMRLETLKRSLGARGDARGALAIQDEIDSINNASNAAEGASRFVGAWRITSPDHPPEIFTIKPDGSATWCDDGPNSALKHPGKIKVVGKDTLLEFDGQEAISRLSVAGDKMALEVWVPKTAYPNATPGRASGVRVGDHRP